MYGVEFRKAALNVYFYFNNIKKAAEEVLSIGVATLWRWIHNGIERKQRSKTSFSTVLLDFVKHYVYAHTFIRG